jgi:hypothetical protein
LADAFEGSEDDLGGDEWLLFWLSGDMRSSPACRSDATDELRRPGLSTSRLLVEGSESICRRGRGFSVIELQCKCINLHQVSPGLSLRCLVFRQRIPGVWTCACLTCVCPAHRGVLATVRYLRGLPSLVLIVRVLVASGLFFRALIVLVHGRS